MNTDTLLSTLKHSLHPVLDRCPPLLAKAEDLIEQASADTLLKNLASLGRQTDEWLIGLADSRLPISSILNITSRFNDWVSGQIIRRTESRISETINLPAPVPYCWINMGSGARHEQIIRTDQDNAIIFKHPVREMETRAHLFFEVLSQHVNQALADFGFQKCPGEVMASNPDWRRSDREWTQTLNRWIGSTDPADIRKLTIFLDFRPVFGDVSLADQLSRQVFELFRQFPQTSHYLVRDDKGLKLPDNLENESEDTDFNLKTGGLIHLVNYIRLLAVNNGIQTPSSLERLKWLALKHQLTENAADTCRNAFLSFMQLRLISLTNHFTDGSGSPNTIRLGRLTDAQREMLLSAVRHTNELKKTITDKYNVAWMNYFG